MSTYPKLTTSDEAKQLSSMKRRYADMGVMFVEYGKKAAITEFNSSVYSAAWEGRYSVEFKNDRMTSCWLMKQAKDAGFGVEETKDGFIIRWN